MIEGGADLAAIARRGMPFPIGVGIRRRANTTPALHALEEQSLGPRAVERRRVYFSMGRAAAREALAELGIYGIAIERGPSGEPLWPDGIVGAISHAGDVAIAIVGRQNDYAGLGIDAELTWHPERCAFDARLLKAASAAHPRGALLEVRCTVVGTDVLSTTYAPH